METVHIKVEHVDSEDMPGGIPAFWTDAPRQGGGERVVTLYLRADLPVHVADFFRAHVIRDCVPGALWDDFTVTAARQPLLRALSA